MRSALRCFLWVTLFVVGLAEGVIILGYVVTLLTQGPRGVVGHFVHIAFSGRTFPTPPGESERIFWTSTGEILAAEFGGLLVVYGAWRWLKRLGSA